MNKNVLVIFFMLLFAMGIHAQSFSWNPEDFLGEWEVRMLFEVNDGVAGADGVPDYTYFDLFTIMFMSDETAIIQRDGAPELDVRWYADDFVLTVLYPDDGDFQYTAFYQYSAVDFGTIVIALYDIFQAPRVGIMKRMSIAF